MKGRFKENLGLKAVFLEVPEHGKYFYFSHSHYEYKMLKFLKVYFNINSNDAELANNYYI